MVSVQLERVKARITRFYGIQKNLLEDTERVIAERDCNNLGAAILKAERLRGVISGLNIAIQYVEHAMDNPEFPFDHPGIDRKHD